jgi:hypothetical protein
MKASAARLFVPPSPKLLLYAKTTMRAHAWFVTTSKQVSSPALDHRRRDKTNQQRPPAAMRRCARCGPQNKTNTYVQKSQNAKARAGMKPPLVCVIVDTRPVWCFLKRCSGYFTQKYSQKALQSSGSSGHLWRRRLRHSTKFSRTSGRRAGFVSSMDSAARFLVAFAWTLRSRHAV